MSIFNDITNLPNSSHRIQKRPSELDKCIFDVLPTNILKKIRREGFPPNLRSRTQEVCRTWTDLNEVQQPSTIAPSPESPTVFDRTVVVEIYNPNIDEISEKNRDHELLSNYEQGLLAKKFHPDQRYIWCLSKKFNTKILTKASHYRDVRTVLNFAESDHSIPVFTSRTKLIVVAQGDDIRNTIAGLEPDAFIEAIYDDLEAKKLAELELIVCNIGKRSDYIKEIKEYYPKTKIISYKCLLAVSAFRDYKVVGFDEDGQFIKEVQTEMVES